MKLAVNASIRPATVSFDPGVVVPIPMLPFDSLIIESPIVSALIHLGSCPVVPLPLIDLVTCGVALTFGVCAYAPVAFTTTSHNPALTYSFDRFIVNFLPRLPAKLIGHICVKRQRQITFPAASLMGQPQTSQAGLLIYVVARERQRHCRRPDRIASQKSHFDRAGRIGVDFAEPARLGEEKCAAPRLAELCEHWINSGVAIRSRLKMYMRELGEMAHLG